MTSTFFTEFHLWIFLITGFTAFGLLIAVFIHDPYAHIKLRLALAAIVLAALKAISGALGLPM